VLYAESARFFLFKRNTDVELDLSNIRNQPPDDPPEAERNIGWIELLVDLKFIIYSKFNISGQVF